MTDQPAATWPTPAPPAPLMTPAQVAEATAAVATPPAAAAPVPVTSIDPALLAELQELRDERRQRLAREEADRIEAEARMTGPTHHVHLADGTVIEGSQIGTHHTYGDGSGHSRGDRVLAVTGAYPL